MRVFVAGATGALGRALVPLLVDAGHQVTGMTRSPERGEGLRAAGADVAVADALDRHAVDRVVRAANPESVIHQLTDIPARIDPRKFRRQFAGTDRLRTEGTRNLVDAAAAAGARRVVAQSVAFAYAPAGPGLREEKDPLYLDAPGGFAPTVEALASLESAVTGSGIDGVVLRYGQFYGPGTFYAANGSLAEMVRKRGLPLAGGGNAVSSFIHVHDAAAATMAALDGPPGTYNVVDDDPARASEWLPEYARALGAPPPRRVPTLLVRLAAGPLGVHQLTKLEGASNAKVKGALGWAPRIASWRQGFRDALG